jgi:hypothetical protein
MSGRLKTAVLLSAAIAVLLAGTGCGDDDDEGDSTTPEPVSTEVLRSAEASAERSAAASAAKAKDRYLPGPIEMRAVCTAPTPAPPPETPFQIKCLVEGFGTPNDADNLSYMTNEDWLVPIDSQGKAGEATLAGQARIRAYRRKDDRLDCTHRKARPEKCAPPLPGQQVAPPPTVPQGESAPPQPAPLIP